MDEEATLDTKNYGYPKFWKDSSSTPAKSYVLINTGLKKSKLTSSGISKINLTLGKTSWDFNINGTSLELPSGENSTAVVGSLKKVTEPSGTVTAYTIADLSDDNDIVWIVLTGEVKSGATYGTTFTEEFVATTLDSEESREKAKVSWVKSITQDDVYAIILPKYPSERPLHISFSGFSDREGYSNKSWKSRNILKMRVYEEGAFRDGGAPIDIVGSLDKKDVDGNGGPIGFIPSNSSYGGQELIYVHVLKTFNEASSFNKGKQKWIALSFMTMDGQRQLRVSSLMLISSLILHFMRVMIRILLESPSSLLWLQMMWLPTNLLDIFSTRLLILLLYWILMEEKNLVLPMRSLLSERITGISVM